MNSRTSTPDLLKGIAALFMIQVHIIELFATPEIFSSSVGKFLLFLGGPPVAPLYIFFLGYFIAGSQKSVLGLVWRGVKVLALGLSLNIVLNCNLIVAVNKGLFQLNIWPYVFGVDVLILAGFSIIIIAFIRKPLNKHFLVPVILLVLVAALGNAFLDIKPDDAFLRYTSALIYGSSWWSYFPLLPWFAYALAGFAFHLFAKQYDLKFIEPSNVAIIAMVSFIVFLIFTITYAINISSNLEMYYHHGLLFCLWILIFMAFYGLLFLKIDVAVGNNVLLRYLKWLGKNITIIYVFQWVIIGNIATDVYKTISSPFTLALSFASVLLASSVLCFLWIKLKSNLVQH